jgi:HPt (histidine-containing phosphotransfer) domain-containing protein
MTAHALDGDREKCLVAGMDDYVSKPIDQRKLFAAVESACAHLPPVSSTIMNTNRNAVPFDNTTVLKRVDGDRELLKEVAGIFIEDTPKLLSDIRTAISRADGKALERAAHTLKSSVGNFGAKAAVDAAFQLEQMGRRGDFAHAESMAGALEQQIIQVFSALDALMKEAA